MTKKYSMTDYIIVFTVIVCMMCFENMNPACGFSRMPDYDPNDFAVTIINYTEGTGVGSDWLSQQRFNNPQAALGAPTRQTTGDGWFVPVDTPVPVQPVYPAFRASEIVVIGNGGQLTVKFNHRVSNDINNPYGIDFIIFGNGLQIASNTQSWTPTTNPETFILTGGFNTEGGIVSVSQDGQHWYSFDDPNSPHANSFAATASYNWNRTNHCWSEPLDPTKPVNPALKASDFAGRSLADLIEAYDGSAGGTGFDLADVGLNWIKYVRITDNPNSNATTKIDAIADVSCCGDYKHPLPTGDLNSDCHVDLADFAIFSQHWLECTWDCQ